jgi:hypothetical protein
MSAADANNRWKQRIWRSLMANPLISSKYYCLDSASPRRFPTSPHVVFGSAGMGYA